MPSLLELIKTAGVDAVGSSNPVNVMFGEVIGLNPLSVKVDQRFTLTADFLLVPENMTRFEIDLKHIHSYTDNGSVRSTSEALIERIVIRSGLNTGDKVLLLRIQGGQKYVILDKVVMT